MVADRTKPFISGNIGLFAKKARCTGFGYIMRSSKSHGQHFLQCANKHVAKDACIRAFISVDRLERMVIDEINRLSAEYLDKDELEQNIEFCNNLQDRKKRLISEIAACNKK